jgi:hypothetical protein
MTNKLIHNLIISSAFILSPTYVLAEDDYDFGDDNEASEAPASTTTDNSTEIKADESQVADEGNNIVQEEEAPFTLPYRAKIGFYLGRQTGTPMRLVKMGPAINNIIDYSSEFGTLYAEGDITLNHAYQYQNDSARIQEKYEKQAVLRELYYKKSAGNASLTLGRNIVVWGAGDFLSVVDLVSPSDQSELFFAKPEESRLGQDLFAIDYWHNNSQLTLLISPTPQMDRVPIVGHPYGMIPDTEITESEESEWAGRFKSDIADSTAGVIVGKFHNRTPLITLNDETLETQLAYETYSAAGFTLTKTFGNVLTKFELIKMKEYPYQVFTDLGVPIVIKEDTMGYMAGFDYNHDNYGNIIVEANLKSPSQENKEFDLGSSALFAISWSKSFRRDDLTVSLMHMGFDGVENQLERLGLDFKIDDALAVNSQYTRICVESDDENYRATENFDRYDMGLTYSFDMSR